MAVSAEVLRYRLAVGLFFLLIALVFAAAIAVEFRAPPEEARTVVRPPERSAGPAVTSAEARRDLAAPEASRRFHALVALRALGDPDVDRFFLQALGDPAPEVRSLAVEHIAGRGETFVAYLAPLLADPSANVRRPAAEALRRHPAAAAAYLAAYVAHTDSGVAEEAWGLVPEAWAADRNAARAAVQAGLLSPHADLRRAAARFARGLPDDERRAFQVLLDRIPAETAPAAAPAG